LIWGVLVYGDVCLRFFAFEDDPIFLAQKHSELGKGGKSLTVGGVTGALLCFVTFHTQFHEDGVVIFPKSGVDVAHNKSEEMFLPGFQIQVELTGDYCPDGDSAAMMERRAKQKFKTFRRAMQSKSRTNSGESGAEAWATAEQNSSPDLVLAAQDHTSTEAVAYIPFGLPPPVRAMKVHDIAMKIFEKVCPHERVFEAGAVVFQPGKQKRDARELYLITEGQAQWEHPLLPPHKIFRGESTVGMRLGVGDFYNQLAFVIGSEMERDACRLVAKTKVKVRSISIEGSSLGVAPARAVGLSRMELSMVFEAVAKDVSEQARAVRSHTSGMYQFLKVQEKHDVATRLSTKHNILQLFNLADTEQLSFECPAHLVTPSEEELPGTFFIFSTWIIFALTPSFSYRTLGLGGDQSVVLSIEDLTDRETFDTDIMLEMDAGAGSQSRTTEGVTFLQAVTRKLKAYFYPNTHHLPTLVSLATGLGPANEWSTLVTRLPRGTLSLDSIDKSARGNNAQVPPEDGRRRFTFRLGDNQQLGEADKHIQRLVKEKKQRDKADPGTGWRLDENLTSRTSFGYLLPNEVAGEEDHDAVEQIFLHSVLCRHKHNEKILNVGATERKLFHIVSGSVTCRSPTNQQVLVQLSPGELFGEVSFLSPGNRGAGAAVHSEGGSECFVIYHDTVELLSTIKPLVGVRFYRSLAVVSAFRLRHEKESIMRRATTTGLLLPAVATTGKVKGKKKMKAVAQTLISGGKVADLSSVRSNSSSPVRNRSPSRR